MTDRNNLKNLLKIFYSESVAIVGANKVPGTVPYDIVLNILKSDFQGIVYPVNPKERHIAGVKAYKYIVDIENTVDLAILVFPGSVCHMALAQCGEKAVKAAIITNAGGPGVLTTDATIKQGLQLAQFSESTTNMFRKTLPKTANIKNPVDVIGDARADRYNIAVSQALKDEQVDGVFVILTPQSMTDIETIAREVCMVAVQYEKPLYASFMGQADVAVGIDILQRNRIPHYFQPESMSKAFATALRFKKQLNQPHDGLQSFADVDKAKAQAIHDAALQAGRNYLPEEEASEVLVAYGLPVVESGLAQNEQQAADIARRIGFPIAMKIISDDIVHKFDVKGVALNIQSENEVQAAFQSIIETVKRHKPEARIKGVYVRKMIPAGEEVILGVKRDPSFGTVIMFGLGGIFVEIFRDVSFRVAPVDAYAANCMINETKASALLTGAMWKVFNYAFRDCRNWR